MQHSKDNAWFGRVGDFRKRKQDARTDETCMLFCQIICKSERHPVRIRETAKEYHVAHAAAAAAAFRKSIGGST